MKLVFLGEEVQTKRTTGCSKCGNRVTTSTGTTRLTSKKFALPSQSIIDVRIGVPFEVSDTDGMYLADLTYQIKDQLKPLFKVV